MDGQRKGLVGKDRILTRVQLLQRVLSIQRRTTQDDRGSRECHGRSDVRYGVTATTGSCVSVSGGRDVHKVPDHYGAKVRQIHYDDRTGDSQFLQKSSTGT